MIFLLPTKRLIHNNTQINYIRKKSRNSWEASAPWASVKSATPKLVSKFETQSHYRTSSLMVQHHTIKRNHPAPSFSLGREIKSWAIMSNVPTYLRAVWGTDWLLSHLCWSTNRAWYILEVLGPIRAKMMVWISTQTLITIPTYIKWVKTLVSSFSSSRERVWLCIQSFHFSECFLME